jgi:ribosome-associated protein YbcJ (S4-like RNA binding protein)
MKRTFLDRVRIERQVLKLVNVKFPSQKLNGLTAPAIKSWIIENKEVFVDGELELNHSTKYYIADLKKLVNSSD